MTAVIQVKWTDHQLKAYAAGNCVVVNAAGQSPASGPQRIPTPFPITNSTGKIAKISVIAMGGLLGNSALLKRLVAIAKTKGYNVWLR